MLIALLAVLGVDLIVIAGLLAAVLTRRRWVRHQPGAFEGAIRVAQGEVPGLKAKWRLGYGRWVGDVLVWTKAPFLLRDELVAAETPGGVGRAAQPGEIKRLGEPPPGIPPAFRGGGRVRGRPSPGHAQAAPRAVRA